jgi:hypothetical protein
VKKNGILSVAAEEASGTHDIQLRIRAVLSAAFLWRSLVDSSSSKTAVYWTFYRKMYRISNKAEKNRKKPVETEENRLTKRPERLKVNCGTVLRTRMNTDDSHGKVSAALVGEMQARRADR